MEVHDEWQVAERRYLSERSMALIDNAAAAAAAKQNTTEITKEVATVEIVAS